jgi:hypothetical protein
MATNSLCRKLVKTSVKKDKLLWAVAASIVAAIRLRGQEITRSPELVEW